VPQGNTALDVGQATRVYWTFKVLGHDKVSILAEVAERATDIDLERARKAQERAEMRMRQQQEEVDYARVRAALARALARVTCQTRARAAGTCN